MAALRRGSDAAFAVDGPRGPARVVRSEGGSVGAALSARLSGGVVVLMAAACARCHVFRRRGMASSCRSLHAGRGGAGRTDRAGRSDARGRFARAIDRAREVAQTAVRGVGMAENGPRA